MGRNNKRKYISGPRGQFKTENFAAYKTWSSDDTLSGLSMKSLLDLGMSLPSTVGHNDYEMPPKHGQICGYEGALLTGSWPLPAASTKIKYDHYKMLTFNTPLKGVQGRDKKIRHFVLWENPGKTGFRIVRCFQVKIFMSPNSCIFPYIEKH